MSFLGLLGCSDAVGPKAAGRHRCSEVVVLLPALWLLASVTQNLWIPAVVLGIGRYAQLDSEPFQSL